DRTYSLANPFRTTRVSKWQLDVETRSGNSRKAALVPNETMLRTSTKTSQNQASRRRPLSVAIELR
ncbi:MAG: hypothetical protein ACK5PZ_08735, partial [Pirellula sp.]